MLTLKRQNLFVLSPFFATISLCKIIDVHLFLIIQMHGNFLSISTFNFLFFLPKAQVRLPVKFWSVIPSVCLIVCKLFTCSTSSPDLLGQIQPNLARIFLWWRAFNVVKMYCYAFVQECIIQMNWIFNSILKNNIPFQNHLALCILCKLIPRWCIFIN